MSSARVSAAAALLSAFLVWFLLKGASPKTSLLIPMLALLVIAASLLTFILPELGLMILIFSMLLSPEVKLGDVLAREVVIRMDDILIVSVFLSWLAKSAIQKEMGLVIRSPLLGPILLYLGVCFLSSSLGIIQGRLSALRAFFYILKYAEYFMLYQLTLSLTTSRRHLKNYLIAAGITCALVTLYAYFLIFSGKAVTAPFESPLGSVAAAPEPASLGGYYIVILGVALGLLTQYGGARGFFLFGGLIALLPPLAFGKSRASYAGFLGLLVGLLFLSRKKRIPIFFGALILLSTLSQIPAVRKAVTQRVTETWLMPGGTGRERREVRIFGKSYSLEPSASVRLKFWENITQRYLREHPFFGYGVTAVGAEAQIPLWLGETGLIGFFAYVWLLARLARLSWRSFRDIEDPLAKGLSLGLLAALSGLFVQSLTTNTFIIIRIMEPFWFLAALVVKLREIFPPASAQVT